MLEIFIKSDICFSSLCPINSLQCFPNITISIATYFVRLLNLFIHFSHYCSNNDFTLSSWLMPHNEIGTVLLSLKNIPCGFYLSLINSRILSFFSMSFRLRCLFLFYPFCIGTLPTDSRVDILFFFSIWGCSTAIGSSSVYMDCLSSFQAFRNAIKWLTSINSLPKTEMATLSHHSRPKLWLST